MPSHEELLEGLLPIARAAGDEILEVYATDFGIRDKSDASPVTDADERAEALILRELSALTPDIPIVSEEAAEAGLVPEAGSRFWLVDPLDGTKEFISRNGEFTTNIALIDQGRPCSASSSSPPRIASSPAPPVSGPSWRTTPAAGASPAARLLPMA